MKKTFKNFSDASKFLEKKQAREKYLRRARRNRK